MIRKATPADIPEVLRMGRKFFETSGYAAFSEYSEPGTAETLQRLVEAEEGILLVADGGFVMGINAAVFFDPSTFVAHELAWWVEPEARGAGLGKALLEAFENEARRMGARAVNMMTLGNSPEAAKRGLSEYIRGETQYWRLLWR